MIGFKKIKFFTNENVGDGKLELPENEMHTTAFWITLSRELLYVASLGAVRTPKRHHLLSLLYALESMAALLLMCDRRDLPGTAPSANASANAGSRNRVAGRLDRR